jgi:hypothetical protein
VRRGCVSVGVNEGRVFFTMSSPLSLLDVLPADALHRSVPYLPSDRSPALMRMLQRLQRGHPLTVTTLGMSTTFDFCGCYGERGCAQMANQPSTRMRVGWGTAFMRLINQTWPHSSHQLYNRASGASNPSLATMCLASHLQPHSDILVIDFNLGKWSLQQQEHLARVVALMPRAPLLVCLGMLDWCNEAEAKGTTTSMNVAIGSSRQQRRWQQVAERNRRCADGFTRGRVASHDPIGRVSLALARHYGHVFVDVFEALRPLVGNESASPNTTFSSVRRWTKDGVHPVLHQGGRVFKKVPRYSEAIAAMLAHAITSAAHPPPPPRLTPGSSSLGRTLVPSAKLHPSLPPPLALDGTSIPRTVACFGWLSHNLPPPRVLRNESGPSRGAGWFVSEVTLHGAKRSKPGLVSIDKDASIDLELGLEVDVTRRGGFVTEQRQQQQEVKTSERPLCIGLTFLTSYEHMAAMRVECLGSSGCHCEATIVDGLDLKRHNSIFQAIEIGVLCGNSAVGSGGCAIRLTNVGVTKQAPPAGPTEGGGGGGGGEASTGKFRLAGIYVTEPWGNQSNHGHCLLEARGQSLNDYGDYR